MKPTKHATTNFRMVIPFIDAADAAGGWKKYTSGGYMPLSVENLGYKVRGGQVYAIAHYGEQNGDAMADPDMQIAVDRASGTVEPLTYQNDYMGRYQEVYCTGDDGRELYRPKLRAELDHFLWLWLKNIHDQGFSPAVGEIDTDDEEDSAAAPDRIGIEAAADPIRPADYWQNYALFA